MKKLVVIWLFVFCFLSFGSIANDLISDLNPSGNSCENLEPLLFVNGQDTVIFDFSDAFCTAGYMQVPVRFNSDDQIYAMDFALHFDPGVFSYLSIVNHKAYLSYAASYNSSDSTLRFSSYSFQPMDNNSNLISIRFSLPVSQIDFAQFDSVYTLLNGDNCSSKAISSIPPPIISAGGSTVIFPGDSLSLSIQPLPGFSYLWSNGETDSLIYINGPGTYSVNAFYPNGCNAISFITISPPDPLPVELVDFDAKIVANGILVSWSTAAEINSDFFLVEHSDDGLNWLNLAEIDGAGNSSSFNDYSVLDKYPFYDWNYYRLKQYDFDGHFSFSNVIDVKYKNNQTENAEIIVYPNPSKEHKMQIKLNGSMNNQKTQIKLLNSLGKLVFTQIVAFENQGDGWYLTDFSLDTMIQGGIYTLVVETENSVYFKELFLF